MFGNTLSATTTAADVKALVDSFFEASKLSWQSFKHICTDGDPAMIGAKTEFVTLMKNKWSHMTSSHCSLNRCTLISKALSLHFMEVMDVAAKVINFICSRAKIHQLFRLLAKDMRAQHMVLLFYTEVRWLSRGKCLYRLYELKNKVEIFLQGNKNNHHVQFHNEEFDVMLAYLANVLGNLNDMNLSLQDRNATVSDIKTSWLG